MTKLLTPSQVESFQRNGYLGAIRGISTEQAARARAKLEDYERSVGHPLSNDMRSRSHLLFSWVNDIIREERILDAVEDVLGANLLCWSTNFFIKEAANPAFVSWHQDSTYWGLSSPDVVTAWLALSPSTKENGALEVVPGSHLMDQIPHRDTFAEGNLLTRGQEVAVDVDPAKSVMLELQPGEFSLHHVRIIHGSAPNPSQHRRIGLAIRYLPTSVRQLEGDDSATLVRGVDPNPTFEHEPTPTSDLQPEFVQLHQRLMERSRKILYKGSSKPA